MKEFLIRVITDSNPASVLNIFLNMIQISVTVVAFLMLIRARRIIKLVTTDGTKWMIEQALKTSYDDHFSRLYQRVDAIATCMGKEFLCNPEHLIPHRGITPDKKE